MIFKIKSPDREEYATAKSQLHLLQSYAKDLDGFQDIEEVTEVSDEEAKTIMLRNTDWDEDNPDDMPREFPLYDSAQAIGDEFEIIGSTEWI